MDGVDDSVWSQLDADTQSRIQASINNHFSGGMARGDDSAQQLSSGVGHDVAVAACKAACSAAQAAAMEECLAAVAAPPPIGEIAAAACEAAAIYAGGKCRNACDNI
jgi:hypothetical protein